MEPGRLVLLLTFIIYVLFYDTRILYIFLSLWGALLVFHLVTPNLYNSTRRKLMIATWDEPREGVIKFKYEADVTQVNEYIKEAREKSGVKITLMHVVLRIVGDVLANLPDVNGRIVFGKYFPYDKVNISCLVDIDGGKDLAVALVEDCDKRAIEDIAETVNQRANKIKTHTEFLDEIHKNQISTFKLLPSFLISFMTHVAQIISVDLGLSIPALSLKKYQFGSAIVTNIGALNIKDAFAPFTPFARVPMLITLCETVNRPVVKGDKIEIAPIAFVNFTIDHRFLDGGRVKKLVAKLDEYFADPRQFSKLKKDN